MGEGSFPKESLGKNETDRDSGAAREQKASNVLASLVAVKIEGGAG